MYKLSDIYNSDSAPSFASAILAIGASALFSIGLLMILNSHNNAQTKRLEQTIEAVQKSQEEGTDINTALAEIQASNDKKYLDKSAVPKQSTNFDTVTIKNDGDFQGGVKVGKDVYATGKIESKGEIIAGGLLTARGDTIVVGELGVSNNITAHSDLIVEGDASLESAATNGDLSVGGNLTVSGDFDLSGSISLESDLQIGGYVDASGFTIAGEDISSLFQEVGDYQEAGNYVTFDDDGNVAVDGGLGISGDLSLTGHIVTDTTVDGVLTVGSLTNPSDLTVTGSTTLADLAVTGSTSVKDIIVDGNITISGDIDISDGRHILGNDDTRGTVTVPQNDTTVHYDFDTPYTTKPTVVASPTATIATTYFISATTTGFDIYLSGAAVANTSFDYMVQE